MLKHATLLAATALAASTIALAAPANADGGCSLGGTCSDGGVDTGGGTITVTVTGSFVKGGSDGSGGTTTVGVPAPCWYEQGKTGKAYYQWVKSGKAQYMWYHTGGDGTYVPYPGYEKHKNDTKGHYYGGVCSSETFGDDLDAFFAHAKQWFAEHGPVYVPGGHTPPTPPVPDEVLLQAAQKAMTLPTADFAWNPQGATLVNLPTWFWLQNPTVEGSVTASIPTKSVTVAAKLTSTSFSSPDAGSVACDGTGVAWSAGATSDCTLKFQHASDGAPVTATTRWGLTWSVDGAPRGALDPITQTATENVGVNEVRTLVRMAQ